MEFKKLMTAAAMIGAMSFGASTASADSTVKAVFDGIYPSNTNSCYICHTGTPGPLTAYGSAYKNAGGPKVANNAANVTAATDAINAIDAQFATQIANNTLPDAAPAAGGGGGGGGCVTSSITTPLTMALAMLVLGFFVRRKKD